MFAVVLKLVIKSPKRVSHAMKAMTWAVVFVAASAFDVSGVAWGGPTSNGTDFRGMQYVQNDDGSEVVVPPIRNGPGQGGQQFVPPGNPSVPPGQPQGGVRFPAPQLPAGYGNFCYFNPRDGAFGPIAPIGAPCNVVLPNGGFVPGRVGVAGQLPPVLPLPGSQ